jgi:hypothetical protein
MTLARLRLPALLILLLIMVPGAWGLPRHRNPLDLIEENPHPSSLFQLYGYIFSTLAGENFSGASSWLSWAGRVYTTPDMGFILDRFNNLTSREIHDLNQTRHYLNLASRYLRWMRVEETDQSLLKVSSHLREANLTLSQLRDASQGLAELLKTSPQPLLEELEPVEELARRYLQEEELIHAENLINRLRLGEELSQEEWEEIHDLFPDFNQSQVKPLIPTRITLIAEPNRTKLGERVRLHGELSDGDGEGLGGRIIQLFLDNRLEGLAQTDSQGRFEHNLTVPYLYKESIILESAYTPRGGDEDVYASSRSHPMEIQLIYHTPVISMDYGGFYPGRSTNLSGRVTHDGKTLKDITLDIRIFQNQYRAKTDDKGRFNISTPVPGDLQEGSHILNVETMPRELYGPATLRRIIRVERIELELDVELPRWALSGSMVKVEGRVRVNGNPLTNCPIEIVQREGIRRSTSTTDDYGEFSTNYRIPMNLFTSKYIYSIKADPVEPWLAPSRTEGGIFVVNIFTLLGGPILLLGIVYFGTKRIDFQGLRRARDEEEELIKEKDQRNEFEEPGNAVTLYGRILGWITRVSGLGMGRADTLREYLEKLQGRMSEGIFEAFQSLSLWYERWLYSEDGGISAIPDRVRSYYLRIKELLGFEN